MGQLLQALKLFWAIPRGKPETFFSEITSCSLITIHVHRALSINSKKILKRPHTNSQKYGKLLNIISLEIT